MSWREFIIEHLEIQIDHQARRIENLNAAAATDQWYREEGRLDRLVGDCRERIHAFEAALEHFRSVQ